MPQYRNPQSLRLVGSSEAIRVLEGEIVDAARCDVRVLITGETGVGKEVVARLIHRRSTRVSAPLLTLNCAGLPDSLLESELFGHVRGAFTGAYRDKPGLLEMAPNGTLFLDEVGEMSLRMQAVILRFLETGEIQRVGADRVSGRVDCRLITATNRDLQAMIAAGEFREDLYYRLNVMHLHLPPLRERPEDIPTLLGYYLNVYGGKHGSRDVEIAKDVMDTFLGYAWPGNVRELKNVIERLVVRTRGRSITHGDLPDFMIRSKAMSSLGSALDEPAPSYVERCITSMLRDRESFWSAVYAPFMARDLTRADLRRIVQVGLQAVDGDVDALMPIFNMPDADHRRFLNFLRKHDCHQGLSRLRAPAERRPHVQATPISADPTDTEPVASAADPATHRK